MPKAHRDRPPTYETQPPPNDPVVDEQLDAEGVDAIVVDEHGDDAAAVAGVDAPQRRRSRKSP